MNEERTRSVWNVIALVATLGVAVVVAVVAVTRSDRTSAGGSASPAVSPSPTPSPTAPGTLAGKGPYLVYATGSGEVFSYDIAAAQWVSMGHVDDEPVPQLGRQPGSGAAVAFATDAGTVWRVDRTGLERVAILPVANPLQLEGGVVSRDGRRFAIASVGVDPELIVVDLSNGRTSAFERKSGSSNRYPREPLVPVAWSLGGSLVYQVPMCDCDTPSEGLYVYDVDAERSSLVSGTAQAVFDDDFAISPDGQELVWGDAGEEPCENDPESTCPAPPYRLRRLAAGRQSSTTIRRQTDRRFARVDWSSNGEALLIVMVDPDTRAFSYELAEPESGDRIRAVGGIAEAAGIVAVLPEELLVMTVGAAGAAPALQTFLGGKVTMVAEAAQEPIYLGWIR